jgi:hypothetical protein
MVKPDYPEILRKQIDSEEELDLFQEKLKALFYYYDVRDDKTGLVDWRGLAINLAMNHVPGFQIKRPKPTKKRDAGRPATAASRDMILLCKMKELIDRDISARNASRMVYRDHPELGNSAEAIRKRWMKLRGGGPDLWRAVELYVQFRYGGKNNGHQTPA